MQTKSTAFHLIVESNSIVYDCTVQIISPVFTTISFKDMAIESITVDRSFTTDMPDLMRFDSGYSAASATVTLSGMVIFNNVLYSIDTLLNPWNASSPFYLEDWTQYKVLIDVNIYEAPTTIESCRRFTGIIDEFAFDHNTGSLVISCIDNRDKLRGAAQLPPASVNQGISRLIFGSTVTGLYGSYVIDYLFSTSGLAPTSPPARPLQMWQQTSHGGGYPQVTPMGQVDTWSNPNYLAGKYHPQVPLSSSATVRVPSDLNSGTTNSQYFGKTPGSCAVSSLDPNCWSWEYDTPLFWEGWIYNNGSAPVPGANGFNGSYMVLTVDETSGISQTLNIGVSSWTGSSGAVKPGFRWTSGATNADCLSTQTIPADSAWHYVGISVVFDSASTNLIAKFWVDSNAVETITNTSVLISFISPAGINKLVTLYNYPIENNQLTREANPTVAGINNLWAPTITPSYDVSLNQFYVVPDVTQGDAWAIVQAVADAEQAVCGLDENGTPFFTNRNTLRGSTAVRTVTSRKSLKALSTSIKKSTMATDIQVAVNSVTMGPLQQVWSASELIAIPATSSYIRSVTLSDPAQAIATPGGFISQDAPIGPGAGQVYHSGYRANTLPDGTGAVLGNLTMAVQLLNSTTVLITVYNPNTFPVYLVTGAGFTTAGQGSSTLVLGGVPYTSDTSSSLAVAEWPPTEEGGASTGPRGDIVLPIPANPWVQIQPIGQRLADDLLADLYVPRPFFDSLSIVMDPSLQLGDRITIVDPDRSFANADAQIYSITDNISATDASQTIGARTISAPGLWIMNVSTMGVNTRV